MLIATARAILAGTYHAITPDRIERARAVLAYWEARSAKNKKTKLRNQLKKSQS
jgi:hypothetical protein